MNPDLATLEKSEDAKSQSPFQPIETLPDQVVGHSIQEDSSFSLQPQDSSSPSRGYLPESSNPNRLSSLFLLNLNSPFKNDLTGESPQITPNANLPKFVFPTSRQPLPPQSAFQLFAKSLLKEGSWSISEYKQAWSELRPEEILAWNQKAEEESIRLKNAQTEWDVQGGGEFWNKRVKNVVDKVNVPIKSVGQEMRRFPSLVVNATAVRAMTNAVELFVAMIARESYLNRRSPNTNELRLIDVHQLIHEEDRCFGFLKDDFDPPSMLETFVDVPDSPKTRKSHNQVAAVSRSVFVPAAGSQHPQQHSLPTTTTTTTVASVPASVVSPQIIPVVHQAYPASKGKMLHRPKCSYNNVQKMYEAMKPGAVWNEEVNKEYYYKEFQKMKDEHVVAEARWKNDYPSEYQELLDKRKADQNRAKKRRNQAISTTGSPGEDCLAAAVKGSPLVSGFNNTFRNAGAVAATPAASLFTLSQQSRTTASVAKPIAATTKPTPPTTTRVVDDNLLPVPWKRVFVQSAKGNDECYFWNTETGETTWDFPATKATASWKA